MQSRKTAKSSLVVVVVVGSILLQYKIYNMGSLLLTSFIAKLEESTRKGFHCAGVYYT